jgi:hypothetical protein
VTNLEPYIYKGLNGTNFTKYPDPEAHPEPANPCGLVAYSVFTDTFALYGPFEDENLQNYQAGCCQDNHNDLPHPQFTCVPDVSCPADVSNNQIILDNTKIAWKADNKSFVNTEDYMNV